MSHLTLETIARLVEEPPAPDEAAHLDRCTACRHELEDMRADAAALAALPAIEPPAEVWASLESRMTDEGLVRRRGLAAARPAAVLRMAAAIALFALGGAAGAAWIGERQPAAIAIDDTAPAVDRVAGSSAAAVPAAPALARVETAGPPLRSAPPAEAAPPWLRANPRVAEVLAGGQPADYGEAVAFYREAEQLYLNALTRMAELGGGTDMGDPYARLAALEAITSITRAALGQAPADPVLNGYHVTALAQRDATLRQIAARTTGSWF